MKTYVLMLSKQFPTFHERAGEPTGFQHTLLTTKIHTIRANFELWSKRIQQVSDGLACISIRQWEGLPYRGRTEEILKLYAKDGVGIQRLHFHWGTILDPVVDYIKSVDPVNLAHNDGLSTKDWSQWLCHYDLTKPMAIIHFTQFRY